MLLKLVLRFVMCEELKLVLISHSVSHKFVPVCCDDHEDHDDDGDDDDASTNTRTTILSCCECEQGVSHQKSGGSEYVSNENHT